jgi:hypothetical protein
MTNFISNFVKKIIGKSDKKTVLTAKEFLDHLYISGDFRAFGEYEVCEDVVLSGENVEHHMIHLGEGSFKRRFVFDGSFGCEFINCDQASFTDVRFYAGTSIDIFFCDQASFTRVWFNDGVSIVMFICGSASFGEFICGSASVLQFHCSSASFGQFRCDSASFGQFNCDSASFEQFNCDSVSFEHFDFGSSVFKKFFNARNHYALGMVYHHYKLSGVHLSIERFTEK